MPVSWTLSRNNFCTGTATVRMLKFMQVVKEALEAAGWVLKGNGDGVDGYDFQTVGAATNHWDTFASGTTNLAAGAWYCHENADGAQVVLWSDSVSGTRVGMWQSISGGYTTSMGEGISTRVGNSTPPADERTVIIQTDGNAEAGGSADYYADAATSSDGNSIIAWGLAASIPASETGMFFVKLEGAKAGDAEPYASFRVGSSIGSEIWDADNLSDAALIMAHHVTAGFVAHSLSEFMFGGTNILDTIPVDPNTGNHNAVQCMVGSDVGGALSIKGIMPGMRRVSSSLSQADLIGTNGAYTVIGDYGLPWNSTSPPSS